MMKKRLFLLLAFICFFVAASAGDTTKIKRLTFISFQPAEGLVMPTPYINGNTKAPNVVSLNLKYGFHAKGDKWEDHYFGMPYKGIGIYKPFYSMNKELGNPFGVYLFQGAKIKEFKSGVSLNYEINLGLSFNWNHYNIINNPDFKVFGSGLNALLGGSLYFKKPISNRFDFLWGIDFLHFSNGAWRTPNNGLNSLSANVGVAYNITNDSRAQNVKDKGYTLSRYDDLEFVPPGFEKQTLHDISFFVTKRTLNVDTVGTNMKIKNRYIDRSFIVAGLNYAFMWHNIRRFMWGPSVEMLYDEGLGVEVYGDVSKETDVYYERVELGKISDRFIVGLSLRGELVMPGYSIFGNLGYNVLSSSGKERRFYQTYGVKIYLTDGLSSSFGVKSYEFTKSKYLFLSVGYTFRKAK